MSLPAFVGINATSTAEDHFGGFEAESSDRSKSKADVMREVMAKSKMHKMERQQMRDADDELRAQLDDEIGDIRSLLMSSNIPPPTTEAAEATGPNPPMKERSAGNDYDGFVRELAFERRAKPQDRLKTEAELAEEEASQLRAAELARIRRMRGEPAAESEQDGSRKRSAPQGDDLADDFDIDGQTAAEVYGLGTGLGGEEADDNGAESESDEDEGSSDGEQDPALEADGYGSALEDESDDSADGEDGDESIAPTAKDSKSQQTNNKSRKGADAVPFTFECPVTHEAFLSILDEHSLRPSQVPLVVKRIRALHHPSLAEDNKFKLQGFAGVLLDHALYCASQAVRVSSRDERAELMALIDHLLKPIFELATTYPKAVAEAFVEKLALMERNLTKGLSKGATKPTSRTWPGAAELTLVRLAGLVWPTSDLNHVVTTPLALLEAHYLAHCRIRSYADLTSGLFLLTCFVQQQAGSEAAKRMMPEVLNFAHNAIILLSPLRTRSAKEGSKKICENFGIPTPDFGEAHAKHLALPNKVSDEASNPDLFQLLGSHSATDADEIEEHDTRKSLDLLNLVLALVPQLSLMYQGTAAFVELFEPIRLTLDVVRKTDSFTSFTALDQCYSTLNEQLDRARHLRRPLRLHAHRAIPLASFVPKFDEGGRRSRSGAAFDPDSARAETAKLKALLKKEKKGAVRELRRDAQFLAQHRAEEKRKEDEIYRRKMGKITAALGEERGEEKRLQKEKDRIKRKAGGSR